MQGHLQKMWWVQFTSSGKGGGGMSSAYDKDPFRGTQSILWALSFLLFFIYLTGNLIPKWKALPRCPSFSKICRAAPPPPPPSPLLHLPPHHIHTQIPRGVTTRTTRRTSQLRPKCPSSAPASFASRLIIQIASATQDPARTRPEPRHSPLARWPVTHPPKSPRTTVPHLASNETRTSVERLPPKHCAGITLHFGTKRTVEPTCTVALASSRPRFPVAFSSQMRDRTHSLAVSVHLGARSWSGCLDGAACVTGPGDTPRQVVSLSSSALLWDCVRGGGVPVSTAATGSQQVSCSVRRRTSQRLPEPAVHGTLESF